MGNSVLYHRLAKERYWELCVRLVGCSPCTFEGCRHPEFGFELDHPWLTAELWKEVDRGI